MTKNCIKVFLTSPTRDDESSKWVRGTLIGLLKSYNDCNDCHQLVNDPDLSDLIIFTDPGTLPHGLSILLNPLFIKYNHKCFIYDENDFANYWYRAINVSGCKSLSIPSLTCGGAYVRAHSQRANPLPFPETEDYLFSFIGAAETHPVREKLRQLYTAEGVFFDVPRSITQTAHQTGCTKSIKILADNMNKICQSSLFVLCPRGVGASSMRLFEVMSMGRCPVIISDEWIEPHGPNWDQCSIRIPESQVSNINDILMSKKSIARQMGQTARLEWETWFAPNRHFETIVESCLRLYKLSNNKSFSKRKLIMTFFSFDGLKISLRYLRNKLFHSSDAIKSA